MKASTRTRLYEAYASSHAGVSGQEASPSAHRDVIRHLPDDRSVSVVDIGCGQGGLVRAIGEAGFGNARGIDISPEQIALAHDAGVANVVLGDFREILEPSSTDVVVATDFLEHLTKDEVVEAVDRIAVALRGGGRLIVRVPNAVSPFGGNYRHGDLTHETSFTPRSLEQLAAVGGFASVRFYGCAPIPHGVVSLVRAGLWTVFSAVLKLMLAAETGRLRGHLVTQNIVAVFVR